MSDHTPVADDRPSAIVAITAGTNPVTGVEQLVIEYADGSQQVHEGAWSEGREMAHRAGLDHRRTARSVSPVGAGAPPEFRGRTSSPAGGAVGGQQRPSVNHRPGAAACPTWTCLVLHGRAQRRGVTPGGSSGQIAASKVFHMVGNGWNVRPRATRPISPPVVRPTCQRRTRPVGTARPRCRRRRR